MSCSVSSYLSFYNLFFFFRPLPLITKEQIVQGKINFIQSCIVLMKTGSNTKINKLGMCMGHQTSQYSLCISVTQFTFYMVNFYFLYDQLFF